MDESLADRFFEDGLSESVKNRVVDVLVLPDFDADDEAIKIRVVVDELIPNSLIAFGETIPNTFDGHRIEVFEDAHDYPEYGGNGVASPGARYHEVLRPGVACGGRGTTNGTLGAIVYDLKNDGAPSILSNWHVLRGRRRIFGVLGRRTTDIFQPGRLIGGTPAKNVVARYARSAGNNIDAAIATLNGSRTFHSAVFPTDVQFTGVRRPRQGDVLEKAGSRTFVTRGEVKWVRGNRVRLSPVKGDHHGAPEISMSGDSGAVWYYPETGEAAMLHAYGDNDGASHAEWAGGYLMQSVVDALDISFLPPS